MFKLKWGVVGFFAFAHLSMSSGSFAQEVQGLFDCSLDICLSGQTDLDVIEEACLGDDLPSVKFTPTATPGPRGVFNDGWANQGITHDAASGKFYTTRGFGNQDKVIGRWSADWDQEDSGLIDYDSDLKHIGDLDVMGDYIVAPLSDFASGGNLDIVEIAWFDKSTLSLVGTLDFTDLIGGDYLDSADDLSGVCVYDNHLYIVEFETSAPTYVFELDIINGVPTRENMKVTAVGSDDANGIYIKNGFVMLSCGKGVSTRGTIEVYRLEELFQSDLTVSPIGVHTYCTAHIHAQGLTMRDDELWVAQDTETYRIDTPPFPTPSPTPTVSPTPSPSPTPMLSTQAQGILNFLLGITSDPTGLDTNSDGVVDFADLALEIGPQ